jgi:V-type H+-transporting ATPase subunit G
MWREGKQPADTDIDRTKRIKEAREEAKKEIATYRKAKEVEFRKFEAEVRLPISQILSLLLRLH